MNKTVIAILVIFSCFVATITAQEVKSPFLPEIHGTIRAKYEYEPSINKGRFEIRNARLSCLLYTSPSPRDCS